MTPLYFLGSVVVVIVRFLDLQLPVQYYSNFYCNFNMLP